MESSAVQTKSVQAQQNPARASAHVSPHAVGVVSDFVQQFRIGISQALLYTLGTKQFEKACETTFAALAETLNEIGNFKLSIARMDVLINGERVDLPASIRGNVEQLDKMLNAAGLSSVLFEKGAAMGELGPFLQMLARKELPSGEGAKVNAFLQERSISRIKVDELRYVALAKEEKIVSGDVPEIHHQAVAQKQLTELVDATLKSIEKVSDSEARGQLRAELADQLIEKSDAMLPSLLCTASQRLKQTANEELIAIAALPQRDCQLFAQALNVGKQLTSKGIATDDASIVALRVLIASLVAPYQSRAEDILGVVDIEPESQFLLPDWLLKAHTSVFEGTATERLEGLLRQSSFALLDQRMFAQIIDVLDELAAARMFDESGKLMAHLAGALNSATKRERITAIENLSFLLKRSMDQQSSAVKVIEDALMNACTHETCDEVMEMLLAHLTDRCTHHYKGKNYRRALEYLEFISKLENDSRLALKDEGSNLARKAREELAASALAPLLIENLISADNDVVIAATQMTQTLGEKLWSSIIERIRTDTDENVVKLLACHLNEISQKAQSLYFKVLGRENDPNVTMRLIGLAKYAGSEDLFWPAIEIHLRSSNSSVRATALDEILRRDGEGAVKALLHALAAAKESDQRKLLITSLIKLKHPAAQQVLLDELSGAGTEMDQEMALLALDALSAAANSGIIDAAQKILFPSHGTAPKPLVMGALRALAPFYQVRAAAELLEKARADRDPEISRLALVCLRGIVAAEHKTEAAPDSTIVLDVAPAEGRACSDTTIVQELPRQEIEEKPLHASEVSTKRKPPNPEVERKINEAFKAGSTVGSPQQPEVPNSRKTSVPIPASPPPKPDLSYAKSSVEGQIGSFGLTMALTIASAKDGVMLIAGPAGEGQIFVRGRKIHYASYADKTGIAALATIDGLKESHFQYFQVAVPAGPGLEISLPALPELLRKHREYEDFQRGL